MDAMDRRQFVAGLAACACAACPAVRALAEASERRGPVDVGPLEDFKAGGIHDPLGAGRSFFLVSKGGRLYAVSSTCTHKAVKLVAKDGGFKCPRHGSTFAADGKVTKSPARRALPRHAIRLDDRGHVLVDTSATFGEGQWNDAGASIALR
jgi:Rieske Fe-S protein